MIYFANAFSLSMLDRENPKTPCAITKEDAMKYLAQGFSSIVGHEDTARLLADEIELEVPVNRVSIELRDDDVLVVAQYSGLRLLPGTTKLPPGAKFEWWLIE